MKNFAFIAMLALGCLSLSSCGGDDAPEIVDYTDGFTVTKSDLTGKEWGVRDWRDAFGHATYDDYIIAFHDNGTYNVWQYDNLNKTRTAYEDGAFEFVNKTTLYMRKSNGDNSHFGGTIVFRTKGQKDVVIIGGKTFTLQAK